MSHMFLCLAAPDPSRYRSVLTTPKTQAQLQRCHAHTTSRMHVIFPTDECIIRACAYIVSGFADDTASEENKSNK